MKNEETKLMTPKITAEELAVMRNVANFAGLDNKLVVVEPLKMLRLLDELSSLRAVVEKQGAAMDMLELVAEMINDERAMACPVCNSPWTMRETEAMHNNLAGSCMCGKWCFDLRAAPASSKNVGGTNE